MDAGGNDGSSDMDASTYDDDNNDNIDPQEDMNAEFIFGRRKHKKKRRRKKKHRWIPKWFRSSSSFGEDKSAVATLKKNDELVDDNFIQYNDIKNRIPSDKQEAIDKFISNVNEAPQVFNFNIDDFVKQSHAAAAAPSENAASVASKLNAYTEKPFYAFAPFVGDHDNDLK